MLIPDFHFRVCQLRNLPTADSHLKFQPVALIVLLQLSSTQQPSNNGSEGASSSFAQYNVSISGLAKPLVLKCLWDGANAAGSAFTEMPAVSMMMRLLPDMDIKVAEQLIEEAERNSRELKFDYLYNKPMKINISGDNISTKSYDEYNGDGSAKRAIEKARALDRRQRLDQAMANANHPLTDDQLSKLLGFTLYGKGDGKI